MGGWWGSGKRGLRRVRGLGGGRRLLGRTILCIHSIRYQFICNVGRLEGGRGGGNVPQAWFSADGQVGVGVDCGGLIVSRWGGRCLLLLLLQCLDCGLDRLQTSVEWTAVDAERLGGYIVAGEMGGQFVGLEHAVRGQGWVRWVTGWRRKLGVVGAGFVVDCPVETVLEIYS